MSETMTTRCPQCGADVPTFDYAHVCQFKTPRWEDTYEGIKAERDALRAEVERLRASQQWQPIETAPRDGTKILLCRNELVEPVTIGYWSMVECGWNTPLWLDKTMRPIGWMPLPAPPAERGEG